MYAAVDSLKLSPYLILYRKLVPKNETFLKNVIVNAQKKWMDDQLKYGRLG